MNTITFLILTLFNYFVILFSENIDLNQLYVEVNNAFIIQITLDNLKIIASSLISVVTIILLKVFHPFIIGFLLRESKVFQQKTSNLARKINSLLLREFAFKH